MSNQLIEIEKETTIADVERDPTFNKRARRAFKEGYKDGFAGLYSPLNNIPPKFRAHYNAGYALGVYDYNQESEKPEPVDRTDLVA